MTSSTCQKPLRASPCQQRCKLAIALGRAAGVDEENEDEGSMSGSEHSPTSPPYPASLPSVGSPSLPSPCSPRPPVGADPRAATNPLSISSLTNREYSVPSPSSYQVL